MATPASPPDFHTLREAGLRYLQALAGDRWTDHNTHDPGITILEQFCYALTDLNYRAGFPIEDLMAEGGVQPTETLRPRPMLCTGPVSLQDWRMLLLDIPGVSNAWIKVVDTQHPKYHQPLFYDAVDGTLSLDSMVTKQYAEPIALRGLYQIDYVLEETHSLEKDKVNAAVLQVFQQHRNLCEDIDQINRLEDYPVEVEARIEIDPTPDPETLLAKIYAQIHNYIRPSIQFHTLQELQAQGYLIDDIMDGPQLQHGFLKEEELATFNLRRSLRISNLIALIMEIEGVQAVHSLKLSTDGATASTFKDDYWELQIPENRAAKLQIPIGNSRNNLQKIKLWHSNLERQTNWPSAWDTLQHLRQQQNRTKKIRAFAEIDRQPPTGRDRQLALYQSIVHQFPDLYGIGGNGLPASSTPERQAQARQLKAYLSFFDQILANTFSQLAATNRLLGLEAETEPDGQTYFAQSLLAEIPAFAELIDADSYTNLVGHAGEEPANRQLRQKRLTQHLLARFAERFTDFSQLAFSERNRTQQAFLRNYPKTSYRRFTAFDYMKEVTADNVAGLEQRLASLLGLSSQKTARLDTLSEADQGAFYLVEHLLLRPSTGDSQQKSPFMLLPFNGDDQRPPQKDPYSLQLSFVFPNWLSSLNTAHYQQFLAKTLRAQTPAHLKIYLHWLSKDQMTAFEDAYQDWLIQLKPVNV